MSFEHPWWLAALVLAPACAWLRLRAGMPPHAARLSALARAGLLACLALALAGVRVWRRSPELTVLFLLDRSLSLDPLQQGEMLRWVQEACATAGRKDSAGIIAFGADAVVDTLPKRGPLPKAVESVVDRNATDISAALRLAQAILPAHGASRVVLLTDGRETSGDMLAQGLQLGSAGIPVFAVPFASTHLGDAAVERLLAPAEAAAGEPVAVAAGVRSPAPATVTARLFRDDRLIESRAVALPAGNSTVSFTDRLSEPGLHSYKLFLDLPDDPRPENNQASAAVSVLGPPTVLVLEGTRGRGAWLGSALAQAGMRARVAGPGSVPRSLAEFEAYSAVVLSDVPAFALSPRAHKELKAYVGDLGGGLAMFGGDQSFGAGGWLHSPVEEALPVSMEAKRTGMDTSLAIVVVIDRSGSMMEAPFGRQKIELAAEGAMRVVEMLAPGQSIGVCAVDTSPDWIVPLQHAADKGAILAKIGGLRAGGGGIYVYDGLEAAYAVLSPVRTSVRHLILFSDAADSEQQVKGGASALDLVSKMAAEGITVSVLGLGRPSDKDAAFLEDAARRGSGRFYLTEDPSNIPSIFMRETVIARRSALVEEPFMPRPAADIEPVKGIDWSAAPDLKGYVIAQAKEAAQVGLETHRGDPLLAAWRFGLGKSVAFTSDAAGRWSAGWSAWPGAGRLWAQSARWILREPASEGLSVRAELRDGELRVSAEAADKQGLPLNFLQVEGSLITPGVERRPVKLSQTGPGRYEAVLQDRSAAAGTYMLHVTASGGETRLSRNSAFTVPYPAEFQALGADAPSLARIAELTKGRWAPEPSEVFVRDPAAGRRPVPLAGRLLALAALLLVLDVAVRRLRFRAEAWEPLLSKARALRAAIMPKAAAAARGAAPVPGATSSAAAGGTAGAGPAAPSEQASSKPQDPGAAAPDQAAPAAKPPEKSSWDRLKEAKKRARR